MNKTTTFIVIVFAAIIVMQAVDIALLNNRVAYWQGRVNDVVGLVEQSQQQTRDALEAAKQWQHASEKWQRASEGFESANDKNVRTARECISTLRAQVNEGTVTWEKIEPKVVTKDGCVVNHLATCKELSERGC